MWVHTDGALHFGFESNIAAHGFPVSIKSQAYQMAHAIDNRTA